MQGYLNRVGENLCIAVHVLRYKDTGVHLHPVEVMRSVKGHEADVSSCQVFHAICRPHSALEPVGVLVLLVPVTKQGTSKEDK